MRFSIIIPAYNAETYIMRSVNSVLNQSFTDFEIVVVDDGSKDNTYSIAREISDKRVRVLSQTNGGVSVARNTGILSAYGDYVCFLDADDEFLPNHLQCLNELITRYPDKAFYCTRFCVEFLNGSVSKVRCSHQSVFYSNVVEEIIKEPELVWTGCVCIKKEAFELYGIFEPGVRLGEDTDLWRRIYSHTGLVFLDDVTVKRNRDGSEATKRYQRKHNADSLCRMPALLSDNTISNEVKESLKKEYELSKLEVVRTYLLEGNKKEAFAQFMNVDKRMVPHKKIMITKLCFFVPSFLLRYYIKKKNEEMYKW